MLGLLVQNQSHRAGTHLRGKLLRRIAHQTFFSGEMVSANPGAVQSLQACEGQPGGGWRRRTVDCGVRGQPCGQPLQALEPAVVRELLSSAGAAGRYSKGEWRNATVGYSDGCRSHRSGGCPPLSGADP